MDQEDREIVRREIEGWLEEGAIDHETGHRLRERYRGPGPDAERASGQVLGLGGHLLGAGLLMLIGALGPGDLARTTLLQALVASFLVLAGLRRVRGMPGLEAYGRSLVVAGVLVAIVAAQNALGLRWISALQCAGLLGMGLWLVSMISGSRPVMVYAQLYLGQMVLLLVLKWFEDPPVGTFLVGLMVLGLVDLVAARLVKDASDPCFRRTSNIQQAMGVWYTLLALYIMARTGWDGYGDGPERHAASIVVVALSTFLLWIGIDRSRALLRLTGFTFLVLEIFSRVGELEGQPVKQAMLVLGLGTILIFIGRAQELRRQRRAPSHP